MPAASLTVKRQGTVGLKTQRADAPEWVTTISRARQALLARPAVTVHLCELLLTAPDTLALHRDDMHAAWTLLAQAQFQRWRLAGHPGPPSLEREELRQAIAAAREAVHAPGGALTLAPWFVLGLAQQAVGDYEACLKTLSHAIAEFPDAAGTDEVVLAAATASIRVKAWGVTQQYLR